MLSIGCHVSIAGGVWNAPKNAADLECETFQIFTRSPQGGPAAEITPEVVEKFKAEMEKYNFNSFVVHCPYYINFGSGKNTTFHSSISVVRQELDRTSLLGGLFVMFHTGSGKDLGKKEAIAQAQKGLIKVLDGYKGKTKLLIEIAAGAGEILGDTFEEVAEIMDPIKNHSGFGGICFDTQHGFASGYDLRNEKAVIDTFTKFDKVIGLKWLAMSHMNDSKIELGGRKDRHEHIGEGEIGKKGFGALLAFLQSNLKSEILNPESSDLSTRRCVGSSLSPKGETGNVLRSMPLILETEHDTVERDIKILKDLRKNLK